MQVRCEAARQLEESRVRPRQPFERLLAGGAAVQVGDQLRLVGLRQAPRRAAAASGLRAGRKKELP